MTGKIRTAVMLMSLVALLSIGTFQARAIGEDDPGADNDTSGAPMVPIINEQGGPIVIRGTVTYTNPLFTLGTAQPLVMLEDQAGFVDRNENYLMPSESQVLGQITSDFFTSPFSYSISMPIEPQAALRDVDNDANQDRGVMVYAIAYWANIFGDPYLEERDLFGGGWSTAYASTRVSTNPDLRREIVGGKLLIYAPDDQQEFPLSFGPDGLLFTGDEPVARLPQGYTVVDLDADPFVFDRSREQTIDLIEPEGAAVDDFSALSYTAAFAAMVDKFSKEYAFTEFYGLDWETLRAEYLPRFQQAETDQDPLAYYLALRDFLWEIPDGHIGMPVLNELFAADTAGGLGMALIELDDGRIITNFILPGGPADQAGIELRAEITEINGQPIEEAMGEQFLWGHSAYGTDETVRIQQLRYVTRFEAGAVVDVTYQNPGDAEATTVSIPTSDERDSFQFSSINAGLKPLALPLEYELLANGYLYVKLYSFSDNEVLTVQLWERMISELNTNALPGLIIDMRQNGGGSGFLADQMAAYFFNDPLPLGNTGYYDEDLGEFYFDPRGEEHFYPPAPELRYMGPITVLVGPACYSACEFFTYDMTINNRSTIVGQYATGGLGGSIEVFFMPEGINAQFTIGRAVDSNGNIHIEGQGVQPDIRVPITEDTVFYDGDPVLEAAIEFLNSLPR